LDKIWKPSSINTSIKIKLLKSLITSIALYGSETWTYTKSLEKRINAFEIRCFRRILGITWKQKITNNEQVIRVEMAVREVAREESVR